MVGDKWEVDGWVGKVVMCALLTRNRLKTVPIKRYMYIQNTSKWILDLGWMGFKKMF
jgi:hypothetical protein